MSILEKSITAMKLGEFKDIVFSNGVLKSTRTLIRNSEDEWEINSFHDGWLTAYVTLNEALDYFSGKTSRLVWE